MDRKLAVALHGFAAALVVTSLACGAALAQEWPAKTIRAIVPLTAGSATDLIARAVLDQVASRLGQPIVVENRPGAGNTIGMAAAAQSDPDGYTVLVNSSSHTIVPATYGSLPFDTLRDLTPVIPLGNMPTVLVVSPSKGYRTLADLVAAAKAKPGAMNYASAGAGNFSHFATEVFRRAAGFEAVHVPSKGAPEALTEVLAERVDFFFSPLIIALPFLKDGRLDGWRSADRNARPPWRMFQPPWKRDFPAPNTTSGSDCSRRRKHRRRSSHGFTGFARGAEKPGGARAPRQAGRRSDDPERGGIRQARREEVALNTKIAASVGVKAN